MRADGALLDSKGIIVTTSSLTVKGLTFEGAAISDALGGNGAGIRDQSNGATTLRVENSTFTNNQNGILTSSDTGSTYQETVEIIGSSFFGNGSGTGQTHAAYIGDALSLLVSNSLFCGQLIGHSVKSRAAATMVSGNQIYDGAQGPSQCEPGSSSLAIDVANGGAATITSNTLVQGPNSPNLKIVDYGEEGLTYGSNSLVVSGNNFTSIGTSSATAVFDPNCVPAQLSKNSFTGITTQLDPANCAAP